MGSRLGYSAKEPQIRLSQLCVVKERRLVGLGQVSASWGRTHLGPATGRFSIVAEGRVDVCDGAHWAIVMKKGQLA